MDTDIDYTTFLDDPAPCDDCPNRLYCSDKPVACPAYQYYVRASAIAPYSVHSRKPTKAIYTKVYNLPVINGITYLQDERYKVMIGDISCPTPQNKHRKRARIVGYYDNYLDACSARRSAESKAGMILNQHKVE